MSRIDLVGQNGNTGEHYEELDAYYAWLEENKDHIPTWFECWQAGYEKGHSKGYKDGYEEACQLYERW